MGQNSNALWVFEFFLFLDAIYFQFLFTHVSFSLNAVVFFVCRYKEVLSLCL